VGLVPVVFLVLDEHPQGRVGTGLVRFRIFAQGVKRTGLAVPPDLPPHLPLVLGVGVHELPRRVRGLMRTSVRRRRKHPKNLPRSALEAHLLAAVNYAGVVLPIRYTLNLQ
jgi:hypothetical protein